MLRYRRKHGVIFNYGQKQKYHKLGQEKQTRIRRSRKLILICVRRHQAAETTIATAAVEICRYSLWFVYGKCIFALVRFVYVSFVRLVIEIYNIFSRKCVFCSMGIIEFSSPCAIC